MKILKICKKHQTFEVTGLKIRCRCVTLQITIQIVSKQGIKVPDKMDEHLHFWVCNA